MAQDDMGLITATSNRLPNLNDRYSQPGMTNHATLIAERCLGNEPAHCQAACPLHIDNRRMMTLIGEGRFDEALAVVEDKLPFPRILGRICSRPCEAACKREKLDEAVAICDLKRFVADRRGAKTTLPAPGPERQERIAIVGGGPAGIMTAMELRKMGYPVILFEASHVLGGAVHQYIPRYRLPRELIEEEFGRLPELGVKVRFGVRLGRELDLAALRASFQAVLLALGAHASIALGIPGEQFSGVYSALDLLGRVNSGRSPVIGSRVAIIGGGDAAIDAARTARRLGATRITVFYRRSPKEIRVSPKELRDAEEEGIRFHYLAIPKAIHGGPHVQSLECLRMSLGPVDASGRRQPIPVSGSEFQVPVDNVVVAIGQRVASGDWSEGLEITPQGTIRVHPVTLQTNLPNVFAAGDVAHGADTVVNALAAGRHAALSMDHWLRGQPFDEVSQALVAWDSRLRMEVRHAPMMPRQRMPQLPLEERFDWPMDQRPERRTDGFDTVDLGFTAEAARIEARRCLSCECRKCIESCNHPRSWESPLELVATLAMIPDDPSDRNRQLPYACNLCGSCAQACPEDLDIGAMMLAAREQLVATGHAPLPLHRPVSNHQRWSTSRLFTLSRAPRGHRECDQVFFPGCGLPAYSPRLVSRAYHYLRQHLPNTGIVLDCCGAPTRVLGDRAGFSRNRRRMVDAIRRLGTNRVILACPNCQYTIGTYFPELEVTNLYRLMNRLGPPTASVLHPGATFSIHDSCVTRYDAELQGSIRELVHGAGYEIREMTYSGEQTRCCGSGGMARYLDPEGLAPSIRRRTDQTPHDILTYCAGCRSTLASVGKPTLHILDLFFNSPWEMDKSKTGKGGISGWLNRGKTKIRLGRGSD